MDCDNIRALRRSPRLALVLPAKCRSRSGFVDQVIISDISDGGCRIDSLGIVFHVGDMVVVRPQALEGLCGVIRWIKDHSAGIEFDRPLYAPVVEHLHRTYLRFVDHPAPGAIRPALRAAA
ncbi:PilZ domain-containing protein [Novosphingobium sp.]|uniref:PilZ domain-containing protein n=1 Tax=Novosphingobium sp. TaxID=1874826 RepID=UPI0035AE24EA